MRHALGVLTGHWDGTLSLWDTRVGSWVHQLCTLAGGELDPAERDRFLTGIALPRTC